MEFDYDFTLLLLIFMRMTGCIVFNPIFSRRNVPVIIRMGLTLMLSIIAYQTVPAQTIEMSSFIVFFVTLMEQLLIGYIVGFIIQMFMSVIMISGDIMDMQIGLSMSKLYDPQSNVSMPLSASFVNAMFLLVFFVSNGHLTLVEIFTKLCTLVPYEGIPYTTDLFGTLVKLFSLILIYAVKMSLPILAAELVTEMGVGLIMRAVPQIDVFVINVQLKVIIGFIMIMLLVPTFSYFSERLITLMFDQISGVFSTLAS